MPQWLAGEVGSSGLEGCFDHSALQRLRWPEVVHHMNPLIVLGGEEQAPKFLHLKIKRMVRAGTDRVLFSSVIPDGAQGRYPSASA